LLSRLRLKKKSNLTYIEKKMPYKDKTKQKEFMKIYCAGAKRKVQQQEKHDCACGGCTNANKGRHIKTTQHRDHFDLEPIVKVSPIFECKKISFTEPTSQ
jgi:hypothetical protein